MLSGYILDINGYGFNGIGSLEEYFAYDIDAYYESIQMGLLYSNKVCELSESSNNEELDGSLSYLKGKEKEIRKLLK